MRISDWSSDVCSSDLIEGIAASVFDMTGLARKNGAVFSHIRLAAMPNDIHTQRLGSSEANVLLAFDLLAALTPEVASTLSPIRTRAIANTAVVPTAAFQFDRSEEHTSELQSLMRISYAVFCLQKKKKKQKE